MQQVLSKSLLLDANYEYGIYDKYTEEAVNRYKEKYGLTNTGDCYGKVGKTTWEHMGLSIDNDYETVKMSGNTVFYAEVFKYKSNNNNLISDNGIVLNSLDTAFLSIGGDIFTDKLNYKVTLGSGTAQAAFSSDYKGINANLTLVSAEGSYNLNIGTNSVKITATAGLTEGITVYLDSKNSEAAIGGTIFGVKFNW